MQLLNRTTLRLNQTMANVMPIQPNDPLTTGQTLQHAIAHHQAGRLQEAERGYRCILRAQPNHPEANHNLGVLAMQVKQPAAALPHFKAALDANPQQGQFWLSYAEALLATGQAEDALSIIQSAMQRGVKTKAAHVIRQKAEATVQGSQPIKASSPSLLPTDECNQLVDLFHAGRLVELESRARSLVEQYPDCGFAWKVLGASLREQGKEALPAMQKAVACLPDDPETHNNLGNVLRDLGKLEAAELSYRRSLELNPDCAEVHSNLATTLQVLGKLDEAMASYRRALEINPDNADAFSNLALLFSAQGKLMMALQSIKQALRIKESVEAKKIFVSCVKRLACTDADREIKEIMVRALTEPWGRPSDLARLSTDLVKREQGIGGCIARAAGAWPRRLAANDLFEGVDLASIVSDPLLCALLRSVPIPDLEMERFLAMARLVMLDTADALAAGADEVGAGLPFYCALARQCFINEYVFAHTDEEILKANELRDALSVALETGARPPALWLVAVASYFPLCSLPCAARLLERQWPEDVASLLLQQVSEPATELQERASIPVLTPIEDEVTQQVQDQYEENPYPRWVKAAPCVKPTAVDVLLRRIFPLAPFQLQSRAECDKADILIAGCGTGQHPINTARRFQGARVLAVDLSISSLSYAKRKTRELGLTSIEYAQADLLKLGALGRSFDVIESVGVLHHLADPWAGWRVLLSLLRPGGFMKLGFYSAVARRDVVRIRDFIAEQGYGEDADAIRRCRQDLVDLDKRANFGVTLKSSDFFSISSCRDLLFHVQEHRMTLADIDVFLKKNNLVFLGFEIDPQVLHAYKVRFPDDCAAINLGQWQIFENENPDIFFSMYQFWVQKPG